MRSAGVLLLAAVVTVPSTSAAPVVTVPSTSAALVERRARPEHVFKYNDPAAAPCKSTPDCAQGSLCIRGKCQMMHVQSTSDDIDDDHGSLDDSCFDSVWPNVASCVSWTTSDEVRICESNSVPPYYVPPYCPFGIDQGYCQSPTDGNSTDCDPFDGMTCPCEPGTDSCDTTTDVGDVLTAIYQYFEFPLNPDPTANAGPKHMYDNSALKTGNGYQVIGAHLNGIQIKGPAEANGFNVDTSQIPLACGGHVTPPVGPGPAYHYHKAATCQEIQTPGAHGPLIGYAADGFAIYGFGDTTGMPVLDECHGHFGAIDDTEAVTYHYHTASEYNMDTDLVHKPYFLGCQGPSVSRCNETVSDDYDDGAIWCGAGCGSDVCVQPGTSEDALKEYLEQMEGGSAWLDAFTINDY